MRRGKLRRGRGGDFAQYNTDSDDDDDLSYVTSTESSYTYDEDLESLTQEDANLEPSEVSAPLSAESVLRSESAAFQQRMLSAQKRRQRREARILAGSPSIARLTFLEIVSIVFVGLIAICCIVSGHPLLVILLFLCLAMPHKVVCPILNDIERRDEMESNNLRRAAVIGKLELGSMGGVRSNMPLPHQSSSLSDEHRSVSVAVFPSVPIPLVQADDPSSYRLQKVKASQEAKHEKFLKAKYREKVDELTHGANHSLAFISGHDDPTGNNIHDDAFMREPLFLGSEEVGVKERSKAARIGERQPEVLTVQDNLPSSSFQPSNILVVSSDASPPPLTLEHLKAHDQYQKLLNKNTTYQPFGADHDNPLTDRNGVPIAAPADAGALQIDNNNSISKARDPPPITRGGGDHTVSLLRTSGAANTKTAHSTTLKSVRFVDDDEMRAKELAVRASVLREKMHQRSASSTSRRSGGGAKGTSPYDLNGIFSGENLDKETYQDPSLLSRLRLKMKRKRKLTFGESSFIDGDVAPNSFFLIRRWQLKITIVYCVIYFVVALVIQSGFSSGGAIENSYNEQQYRFDRSRLFYIEIPFLQHQRAIDNNKIIANNAAKNLTRPTLPAIDETVYYKFYPQLFLFFSLYVTDNAAVELTLSVVLLVALLIVTIILMVSVPKKLRYYDHLDEKQRRAEGVLNYIHDPLFSTLKDSLAASTAFMSRPHADTEVGVTPSKAQEVKVPPAGGANAARPQQILPALPTMEGNNAVLDGPARMLAIGAVVGVDAELKKRTMADTQQASYIDYWTDADMKVASAVLTLNSLTHILQRRQDEAVKKGGFGIGEMRFDYVPHHSNRNIRVAQVSFLLAVLLVVVVVLPSLMVCAPGILVLLIISTVFMDPPKIATVGPPCQLEVVPGEDRPRLIRFPYYCWSPLTDRATKIRSILISSLYYSLCLVFVAYVAFQNPMLEDFNTMPDSLPKVMPFSGSNVQSRFYHRVGLYNIRTFMQRVITVEDYELRLAGITNTSGPNATTSAPKPSGGTFLESIDTDNGLGIPNDTSLTARIIAQIAFLFIAILLTRTLSCSLFAVMLPEYEEDKAFTRQVARLKNAQRGLLRRVRRLQRSEEVPRLEMPHFDKRGYVRPEVSMSTPRAETSPERNSNGSPLGATSRANEDEEIALDPLKGLDELSKEAVNNANEGGSSIERGVQLTTSFIRAALATIYALLFKFTPLLLPPAYAVYSCVSPSLTTAFVIFPLVLAYCFAGKRWRMNVCKALLVVEVLYLSALVAVFALEYQYDDLPVLRWLLIGSKAMQRSLNLSTCNFILGMHALCLVLIVSSILVIVSAVASMNEEDAISILDDVLDTRQRIDVEAARSKEEREVLLRRYAVDLDTRTQRDRAKAEQHRLDTALRNAQHPGAVITADVSQHVLRSDEKVEELMLINAAAESPYHSKPLREVTAFVRNRSEYYRRKWRVQAVVEANNILGTALVKKITALYECRFDADPLSSHKRLLEVHANVHRSIKSAFARSALERLREMLVSNAVDFTHFNVAKFSRDFSQELTAKLVEEALKTNMKALERARASSAGFETRNGTFAVGTTATANNVSSSQLFETCTTEDVTGGMLPGVIPDAGESVKKMDAKKWAELVTQLGVDGAIDGSGKYRLSYEHISAYSSATEHYAFDFEAIRANVIPHIAWEMTSAELLVIHRYVQYYCPPPRFPYEPQHGVRVGSAPRSPAETAEPRPVPADGSPFVETPINLDDLLLICACFKAGGAFLEKAKVLGTEGKKKRDAVLSVLEQDEHFCNREVLAAGGPLRALRELIASNMETMQRGANEGRGADFDPTGTARGELKGLLTRGSNSGMPYDAVEGQMNRSWPIDPALQASARHVNFCYQHNLLELFPTREEREEQRRLQHDTRRAIRALWREVVRRVDTALGENPRRSVDMAAVRESFLKGNLQLNNTFGGLSFVNDTTLFATSSGGAHASNTSVATAGAHASAGLSSTSAGKLNLLGTVLEEEGEGGDESSAAKKVSFLGKVERSLRYLAAEVYMWLRRRGDSIQTLCHHLLISTYFIVAVVGFGVAGYRNYFTFLHFGLMLMLVGVLWSQVLSVSKQIYFLNAYVALTAFVIMAIIVVTTISEEMMTEWPSASVLDKPISGTGDNKEPLLVSIGVQGFQKTSWELLLYFLQLLVLIVQRREYYTVRRGIYSRARLVHVSLPEEAPTFDDEDDIDVRFEESCCENRWNLGLDEELMQEEGDGEVERGARAERHDDGLNPLEYDEDEDNNGSRPSSPDGKPSVILTTEGVEGDMVSVETRHLVGENTWRDLKAWIEWRLLMTSPVFIRLQMYVAVVVGTPLFVALEGFTIPNYWTMFFLLFFICLLTYSIKSDAFEGRVLQCLWLWALIISTVATLTTAAYQSDPFQSFIRLKFGELLEQNRFVGQYCARSFADRTNTSSIVSNSSTPEEVVDFCLREIGYQSFLREKASLNGYVHFAIIFVLSAMEYALLRRYQIFHARHPMPQRSVAKAKQLEEERSSKIAFLRGESSTDKPQKKRRGSTTCSNSTAAGANSDVEEADADNDVNEDVAEEGDKDEHGHRSSHTAQSDPPASLGFMNTATVFILTVVRDNCEKLHWAMCIIAALHVRSLTHAIYVLFFVFGLTGWIPLVYSALHTVCIYFYPISLVGEYWGSAQMLWVGVAQNTPSNAFSDKVTIMVGPSLVFLASLLYLNTVRFSNIENQQIIANARLMEKRLLEHRAREEAMAAAGYDSTFVDSVHVTEASIFMTKSRRERVVERRRHGGRDLTPRRHAGAESDGDGDAFGGAGAHTGTDGNRTPRARASYHTPPMGPHTCTDAASTSREGGIGMSPSPARTNLKITEADKEEEEAIARKALWIRVARKVTDFVLFVYHDLTLTMGYELLLLGLLVFMAVDTIRLVSWFFFLSVVVMLVMGRERVVTSPLFLLGSQVFYCAAVVALQWLYIGHPEGASLGRISSTYAEQIHLTNGTVRYDALKYVGVYPDAALVWTTAITAFLFRLIHSQRKHIVGSNFPAAVVAVPAVIAREKAKSAGTLAHSNSGKGPLGRPPSSVGSFGADETINMIFGTTPEIISYFDETITSLRIAGKSLSFLRPIGILTGPLAKSEAEIAARRRSEQAETIRRRKVGEKMATPKEGDTATSVPVVGPPKHTSGDPFEDDHDKPFAPEGPDLYTGLLTVDQRRLLVTMLSDRDSSVRHRASRELEFAYLRKASESPFANAGFRRGSNPSNSGTTSFPHNSLFASAGALAATYGVGFIVTPRMTALAERIRSCYESPDTIIEWLVWLMMCVYVTPCFIFADAVCGGSLLHFLIGVISVFMMVRRRELYWHPQPMWDRFVAFYVVVLFAQMICQIPPVAKLIEQNVTTPKALGFAGYQLRSSYFDDGTAPADPVMPLTPLRVMAIFMIVLQKRVFNSFTFLYHLIEVHDKTVEAVTEHEKLQSRQADMERANDEAVAQREVKRSTELKKMRQEMSSSKDEHAGSTAAVVEVGAGSVPPALLVGASSPDVGNNIPTTTAAVGSSHQSPTLTLNVEAISSSKAQGSDPDGDKEAVGGAEGGVPPEDGDLLSPLFSPDEEEAAASKQRKKSFRYKLEGFIRKMNKKTYLEEPLSPFLPVLARFFIVLGYVCVRYFALFLTALMGVNFIVSGSVADLLPFLAMVSVGIVWRPWAPRMVYVGLLYYTGGGVVLKMIVRLIADALTVDNEQSRVLSAIFLNMPPNDLAGIRPSDLNRVSRGNVTILDLSFDFAVLIVIQIHLHLADRMGVYAAESSNDVEQNTLEDGNVSDMTQYSTDEEDEDTFASALEAEEVRREHLLYYAVRERMKWQRETFSALLKMNRPHTDDRDTIRLMRVDDRERVGSIKARQYATLSRRRENLTEWDLKASSKGIAGAAVGAKDRSLAETVGERNSGANVLSDPPPFILVWAGSFSRNLGNISGLGIDLYTVTFFWEIITLIVTIFVYPELAGRNTGSIIQSIEDNLLPGPLLAILLIFTLIMVVDRILYTYSARNAPRANLYKWLYLTSLGIGYGICYIYWLNAICARAPLGGPFVMAMKSVYLLLSAFQVYLGYPLFRHHDPFTRRTGVSAIGWSVLLAIPFLWDLRMYLDWCFTRTSLSFEDYLKVEEVHREVYTRFCQAEDQAEKKGTDQSFKDRCITGGLWFIVIFIIIFFPLMYFSGFNPRLADNPVTNLEVALRLDGFGSLYRSDRYVPYTESDPVQRRAVQQLFPSLDLNDYFNDRLFQYVEADTCSADVWGISPQGIDEILKMDSNEFVLNLEVSMTRANSVASDLRITTVNSVSLTRENGQRLQELVQYSLEVPFNVSLLSTPPPPVMLYNVYDPFVRNSPSNIEPFSQTSNFEPYYVDCQLNLNVISTNISGTDQFVRNWCLTCQSLFEGGNSPSQDSYTAADKECLISFQNCDGYDYKDRTSPSSQARPLDINGIYFAVVSDQVPERLALIPSDTGIIALYATFILALASWIRQRLEGAIHRVVLEECQDPQTLGTYVRYIWMSRGGGRPDRGYDLVLEEDLYLEMIDLLRSPDELLRRTKRRQQCYDSAGDRVEISDVPRW